MTAKDSAHYKYRLANFLDQKRSQIQIFAVISTFFQKLGLAKSSHGPQKSKIWLRKQPKHWFPAGIHDHNLYNIRFITESLAVKPISISSSVI